MANRHDLIVVGAGPAGSSTAYHAAATGLDVVILDRQEFPRKKTCGDSMMPAAGKELAMLGLGQWLAETPHGTFGRVVVHSDTATVKTELPGNATGYVIPREQTDAAVLSRALEAGAEFYPRTRATGLLRDTGGNVTGVASQVQEAQGNSRRFEAPLVVVASGISGLAGERTKRPNVALCHARVEGLDGAAPNSMHAFFSHRIAGRALGYGYAFPYSDGSWSIGYGAALRPLLAARPPDVRLLFDRMVQTEPLRTWMENARLGALNVSAYRMGMIGTKRSGQGVLFAGDAAGMVHPISGEGVEYALESGRVAAGWVRRAHKNNDFSARFLKGYGSDLLKKHGAIHIATWAFVHGLPHSRFLEPVYRRAVHDDQLRRRLVELMAGAGSPGPVVKALLTPNRPQPDIASSH